MIYVRFTPNNGHLQFLIRSPFIHARAELPARQGQDFTHANLPGLETDQHHVARLLREIPKRQDCNHKQCEDKSRYFHGFVECNIFDVSDMIVRCHWSLHYQKEAESSFVLLSRNRNRRFDLNQIGPLQFSN